MFVESAATVVHAKFYDVTNSADVFVGDTSSNRVRATVAQRNSDTDLNDPDLMNMRALIDASNTTARTYTIYWRAENATSNFVFGKSNGDTSTYGWSCPFFAPSLGLFRFFD